jgi:ketosteroid isomerase-like protein
MLGSLGKGKGQTTGQEYSNRGHFDYKWEDGKIVELLAYFDETSENNEIAAYTASLEN